MQADNFFIIYGVTFVGIINYTNQGNALADKIELLSKN